MKTPQASLRNLIIFCLAVVSAGWLGYALDQAMQNPPEQSLGMLVWLVMPLATVIILRTFGGDGWRDFGWRPNFKGNAAWYGLSAVVDPVAALLVLGVGVALGFVAVRGELAGTLAVAAVGALIPSFIKNIFEEFAWRGHLAPRLTALGVRDYVGHLIVGVVWWAWHLAYWLFYIDRSLIQANTPAEMALFIFMALINLLAASLVYGEIRLRTNSVWPAVLMHTIGNAVVDMLVITKLIEVAPGLSWLVAPGPLSLLTFFLFLVLGLALRNHRLRSAK